MLHEVMLLWNDLSSVYFLFAGFFLYQICNYVLFWHFTSVARNRLCQEVMKGRTLFDAKVRVVFSCLYRHTGNLFHLNHLSRRGVEVWGVFLKLFDVVLFALLHSSFVWLFVELRPRLHRKFGI